MGADRGLGLDRMEVRALTHAYESGGHRTQFRVEKWDLDQIGWVRRKLGLPAHAEPAARHFQAAKVRPSGLYEKDDCNLIVNSGWVTIMNAIAGSAITKFSTSFGRIGGGTSATAVLAADTDMNAATGATTRQWQPLSANPTVGTGAGAGNGLSFAATFPTGVGNFVWAEFAIDSGTVAASTASVTPLFDHGLASPGTKTSAQTWNVTIAFQWT